MTKAPLSGRTAELRAATGSHLWTCGASPRSPSTNHTSAFSPSHREDRAKSPPDSVFFCPRRSDGTAITTSGAWTVPPEGKGTVRVGADWTQRQKHRADTLDLNQSKQRGYGLLRRGCGDLLSLLLLLLRRASWMVGR